MISLAFCAILPTNYVHTKIALRVEESSAGYLLGNELCCVGAASLLLSIACRYGISYVYAEAMKCMSSTEFSDMRNIM